ncbi:MAG: hypothetical protein U0610_33530 [bacterium]
MTRRSSVGATAVGCLDICRDVDDRYGDVCILVESVTDLGAEAPREDAGRVEVMARDGSMIVAIRRGDPVTDRTDPIMSAAR